MSSFPHSVAELDPAVNKGLMRDFQGERTGFLQVGQDKWIMPSKYRNMAADLYSFKVRHDDTWVVTFPRSGTTLTQEMAWLLGNDMDYKMASEIKLSKRFPYIEFPMLLHDELLKKLTTLNQGDPGKGAWLEQMARPATGTLDHATSPRFIKSHLPLSLLPPDLLSCGCKVLYVARNPMDVVVSGYHLNRLFESSGYNGDILQYWKYFKRDLVLYSPYWRHVTEAWGLRHNPNMLFLFYEDMVKDTRAAIRTVAEFMGKRVTEEQVDKLASHLHIDSFRANPSIQPNSRRMAGLVNERAEDFIRKGKTGDWTQQFTAEVVEEAKMWLEDNLAQTDLRFPSTTPSS